MKHLHLLFLTPVLLSLVSACSGKGWTQEDHGCYSLVSQKEGPALGYSPSSGVTLLSFGGKAFKDMNRNGAILDIVSGKVSFTTSGRQNTNKSLRYAIHSFLPCYLHAGKLYIK